jgi:hypothetical protein
VVHDAIEDSDGWITLADIEAIDAPRAAAGATSYRQLANALNERRVRTTRGGRWHAASVP